MEDLFAARHLALNVYECQKAQSEPFPSPPRSSADEEAMAKMNFRPLHDRVVVQRIDAEE
jgi:hypothetical protein